MPSAKVIFSLRLHRIGGALLPVWSQLFWVKPPDIHPGKVFFPEGLIAWRPIYKTTFSHSGYTLRWQEWFDLTSDVHLRFAQISSLVAILGWLRCWSWILSQWGITSAESFVFAHKKKRYQNHNIAKYSTTQWQKLKLLANFKTIVFDFEHQ